MTAFERATSQFFPFSFVNSFRSWRTVLLHRSTQPFDDALYGVEYIWLILNSLRTSLNSLALNSGPLSDRMFVGIHGRDGSIRSCSIFDTVKRFLLSYLWLGLQIAILNTDLLLQWPHCSAWMSWVTALDFQSRWFDMLPAHLVDFTVWARSCYIAAHFVWCRVPKLFLDQIHQFTFSNMTQL